MVRVFFIEHWRDGYWSENKQSFGGILFANRYKSKWHVAQAMIHSLPYTIEGPIFIREGWE